MSNKTERAPSFDLVKYLHDLYELEKQKYLLEERDKQLKNQQDKKEEKQYQHYTSPDFQQTEYYQQWCNEYKYPEEHIQRTQNALKQERVTGKFAIFLGIVGFIIGLISCFTAAMGHSQKTIIWPIFVLPVIGAILGVITDNTSRKEYEKTIADNDEINVNIDKENKRKQTYNSERYNYWLNKFNEEENQKLTEDNQKENEFNQKKLAQISYIKKERDLIETTKSEIQASLDSMYDLSINGRLCLHPAYRGLSPVAIIYGYMDTGRCTEMEGHEGAYNIYENEKRLGHIIDRLDAISNKLDELNGTMMYLGKAVYECYDKLDELNENSSRTIQAIESMDFSISTQMEGISNNINNMSQNLSESLSGISGSLSNIEVNSANSAYYSEVGSEAATFSAYYDLFKN